MFSKSPSFARKGHQQLTGNDADEKDRIVAGVQYSVRYVGSIEVASVNGTGSRKTEIPVAKVFEQHKKSNGKVLKKMIMTICSKNLSVSEESSGKLVAHFPITKITFCNFDTVYEKAFVFIARDRVESPFKAFVFLCESKAKAREAFKALSLAFTINYESYQASLIRVPNLNDKAETIDEKNSANGMPVPVKPGEEPRGQALAQNFLDTMPRGRFVPHQNGVPTSSTANAPAPLAPIQHKRLLEIVDNRGRSISDPPFSRSRAFPVFLSQPSIDYPACNLSCPYPTDKKSLNVEDDEFTEFAELRSKSRSTTNLSSNQNGNFSGGLLRYDSAPNIWGGFQSACPPIY